MEKIDWDKAPEWADKYGVAGPDALHCWYSDKLYAYISDPKEIFIFSNFDTFSRHIKDFTIIDARPSPSWSGEGLPPVGVVCEWEHEANKGIWHKAEIKYVGSTYLIVADFAGIEQHYYLRNLKFRPIRTPEQIAADERASALQMAICDVEEKVAKWNTTIDCTAAIKATIDAMISLGYRKQENKK